MPSNRSLRSASAPPSSPCCRRRTACSRPRGGCLSFSSRYWRRLTEPPSMLATWTWRGRCWCGWGTQATHGILPSTPPRRRRWACRSSAFWSSMWTETARSRLPRSPRAPAPTFAGSAASRRCPPTPPAGHSPSAPAGRCWGPRARALSSSSQSGSTPPPRRPLRRERPPRGVSSRRWHSLSMVLPRPAARLCALAPSSTRAGC
mmetsp:Transcript_49446/g.119899  ORF Transcript_49446/g.119899 Transcript_49446/m.119899 type:complete len:204 (+) Transcript_49446:2126-2737(+)